MYLGAPITAKNAGNRQRPNNAHHQHQQQHETDKLQQNDANRPKAKSSYTLPKDIGPGLLKFCLTHTDSPNLKDSPTVQRDPKDYEWLRQAMDNLEDDAKKMKRINETLTDPNSTLGQRISSLETLEFFIEDIDNSGDYIKIGGIPILIELMKGENKQIREKATNCLTIISQNEETIQNYMIQIGLGDLAIQLLSTETDTTCREKELSLISSLLGSKIDKVKKETLEIILKLCISFLSPTVDIFIPGQVQGMLTAHSIANSVAGMSKATHILRKILHGAPYLKPKAVEFGMIDALIQLIHGFNTSVNTDSHQTILCEKCESALLTLIKDNKNYINECKNLGLVDEVNIRLHRLSKLKDQDVDEYNTLESLSKILK